MGSSNDRGEKVREAVSAAAAGAVEDDRVAGALRAAERKLGEGRERLGEAVDHAVSDLREDAEDAIRDVRRRARRARKRARKQTRRAARSARGRWRTPAIVAAALAGASALAVGLVKGRALRAARDRPDGGGR